ncbi:hypothetical protein BD410DRAFT_136091 [Rickenella mellea]|uniref:F-box domain-containing protein n=1 Tax=Rickenella mellea TaxID=50990 RepID=A0A4Y7PJ05_9AGAM|nr:hypothetical protein BD410DRAFT_136091 [Rickenella mellea]
MKCNDAKLSLETHLPPEVLDIIVSHVEKPSHLLALALTCKTLSVIILPRHIRYRNVSCNLHDGWDRLQDCIRHPDRAQNIRILTLIGPSDRDGYQHFKSPPEHFLADVIGTMERLSRLNIVVEVPQCDTDFKGFWNRVTVYRNLRCLDVGLACPTVLADLLYDTDDLTFLHELKMNIIFQVDPEVFERMCTFIRKNVNLKMLDISCTPPVEGTLWDIPGSSHFPDLKSLTLDSFFVGFDKSPSPDIVLNCIQIHDRLETLNTTVELPLGTLPPGTLSNLNVLYNSSNNDAILNILTCPTLNYQPRPLVDIGGFTCDSQFFDALDYVNCEAVHSLRDVQFASTAGLAELPNVFPNLRFLSVNAGQMWDESYGGIRNLLRAEWAGVIRRFPLLIAFHGVCFFTDTRQTDPFEEELQQVRAIFPLIERLDTSRRDTVLIIDRINGSWKMEKRHYQ